MPDPNGNMTEQDYNDYADHEERLKVFNTRLEAASKAAPMDAAATSTLLDAINHYNRAVANTVEWIVGLLPNLGDTQRSSLDKWRKDIERARDVWVREGDRLRAAT